jgi:transcriptional regulator with XRE-family HTH domain
MESTAAQGDPKTDPTISGTMPSKVPPSSAFAERLTRLRTARGLTQTELAEKIGSSQRAISRYETVADYPPTSVVIELAHALEVSADELLGLKSLKKVQSNGRQDPETKRLWKKFQQVRALPEKDQRAVIRLLNSLVAARQVRA